MVINYDTEKLQEVLNSFYNITGINLRFITKDLAFFPPMASHNRYCSALKSTAGGDRRCRHSDIDLIKKSIMSGEPKVHICYAGLTDAVVPIIHKGDILGYIILGQLKTNHDFPINKISHLGLDLNELKQYYEELPCYDTKKIDSIIKIITILIKHILLENMLKPNLIQNIDNATAYIDANLHKPLSIKDIEKNTNLSKTTLYSEFHKHFGCTVNEYINRKRIEKSLEYLDTTDMSIDEISQKVGFSSASYYSVIFKKLKGTSPLKYKQS